MNILHKDICGNRNKSLLGEKNFHWDYWELHRIQILKYFVLTLQCILMIKNIKRSTNQVHWNHKNTKPHTHKTQNLTWLKMLISLFVKNAIFENYFKKPIRRCCMFWRMLMWCMFWSFTFKLSFWPLRIWLDQSAARDAVLPPGFDVTKLVENGRAPSPSDPKISAFAKTGLRAGPRCE